MLLIDKQVGMWGGRAMVYEEASLYDTTWSMVMNPLNSVFQLPPLSLPDGRGDPRRMHAYLLAKETINAHAALCRDDAGNVTGVIGVTAGAFLAISNLVELLLFQDGVLDGLKIDSKNFTSPLDVVLSTLKLEGEAANLKALALRFLVNHEMAHLLNGHIDFLRLYGITCVNHDKTVSS